MDTENPLPPVYTITAVSVVSMAKSIGLVTVDLLLMTAVIGAEYTALRGNVL